MRKRYITIAAVGLAVAVSGMQAGQSFAASSCTTATKQLALGYAAPGACVAQAKCTRGVCGYRLRIRVDGAWSPGHSGRITGQARWAWFSQKFDPRSTNGKLTCTVFSGFPTTCSDVAIVNVFANTTLRVLCTIPAGLLPARFVSARVTCSIE
jgi:hypothetical protein